MVVRTSIKGICQSDILIQEALKRGLEDLRANPYLLDFVFANLPNDELTANKKRYGDEGLIAAKDWFLKTNINVSMSYHLDAAITPKIAISLQDSAESSSTLGDISREAVNEEIDSIEILANPNNQIAEFTPTSYDSVTGKIYLSDSIDISHIFIGMYVYSKFNQSSYEILEVGENYVRIEEDVVNVDFTDAAITHKSNLLVVNLESLEFRENYRLDLYVPGNPIHLLYLWSVVLFILLRYKQEYLEKRGFERSTIVSQGINIFPQQDSPENIFARTIVISGFVMQYWPKVIAPKADGILIGFGIENSEHPTSPDGIIENVQNQGWGMEDDTLSFGPII